MYEEKYKKYKLKYLNLKKKLKKNNLYGGNNPYDYNLLILNLNRLKNELYPDFGNDWILTGSAAVLLLAAKYNIIDNYPNLQMPGDFDVLIPKSKPIEKDTVGNLTRKQNTIEKSMTFTGHYFSVDINFLSSAPKYVDSIFGIKLLDPKSLLSYYNDDDELSTREDKRESDLVKIDILKKISELIEKEKLNNKKDIEEPDEKLIENRFGIKKINFDFFDENKETKYDINNPVKKLFF